MPKFNQLGLVKYNEQIKYNDFNDFIRQKKPFYTRLALARPVILNTKYEELAVLVDVDEVIVHQEENGEDTLEFVLPFDNEKRKYIQNEYIVKLADKEYVIRQIKHLRNANGKKITSVYCEAAFYSLQYADPLDVTKWVDVLPVEPMQAILNGTGWRVGRVEITTRRNMSIDEKTVNRLGALRQVADIWGGRLVFNDSNKTVDLLSESSREDPGVAIVYGKNMDEIEAIYDTTDLITRLYPYGKNGLTIKDATGDPNVIYVEKNVDKYGKRVRTFTDERFTNPFHLKEKAEELLEKLSVPRASYRLEASDLSYLTGMEHEEFKLGQIVRVYDKELGVDLKTHIARWDYNVLEPWNTELELQYAQPGLDDLLKQVSDTTDYFTSEDAVDQDQMMNLMVFNYLLNSRAEDGFAYWINNGWEIDNTGGVSGSASFKCVGASSVEKTLVQSVWPSHRDAYTISLQVATDQLTKGPNGRVGVEVVFHYDDGTTSTEWIPLA